MKIFKILLLFLTLITVISCSSKKEEPVLNSVKPVKFYKVKNLNFEKKVILPGIINSVNETNLSFRVGGTIQKIYFKPGELIKKGELIAELDNSDFILKYQEIKSKLESLKSVNKSTESTYKRFKILYKNNNIPLQDLENIKGKYNSELNQIKSIEKSLELLNKQVKYTQLYAPFTGTIANQKFEELESIEENRPFIKFIDPDNLEATVFIPENKINFININDKVKIKIFNKNNFLVDGIITEINSEANSITKTYKTKIKILNADNNIKSGMSCEVIYNKSDYYNNNYFIIPIDSVFSGNDSEKNFVWKFNPVDSTVIKTEVKSEKIVSQGILIKQGLNQDDIIITAGIHFLSDGQKVKLIEKRKLY
jgi:RND family efflux transporter MFP subunit